METIRIGRRVVGPGQPVFIIAEVGSNHNRSLKVAKRLIDVAARAGADAVKFQTFKGDLLYSRFTSRPPKGTPFYKFFRGKTVPEAFRAWELPRPWHKTLATYAKKRGIIFLSTPFDSEAVDLLVKLHLPAFKIASYELSNLPLIRYAAREKKPIILSTGGADLERVRDAVEASRSVGNSKIILLHCVSEYPAPFSHMNLRAIKTLARSFRLPVGLSDHSERSLAAVVAVALGAVMIEKHVTLSRKLAGPDHAYAMEPGPFRQFVQDIRNTEMSLGTGKKLPTRAEAADAAGSSIVAKVRIARGERISEDMLTVKRPARGIAPKFWDRVVGKRAKRDILEDMWIQWEDV